MEVDYLVVGSGLAGILFCEQLRANRHSHVVFNDGEYAATRVASGLYNPVVLKRFTAVWNATQQLAHLTSYQKLEDLLGVTIDHKIPIYRLFNSVSEQNNWFQACDQPILSSLLNPTIIPCENPNINAPYGFGEVLHTGRVDAKLLSTSYLNYLKQNQQLIETPFDYQRLKITDKGISYEGIFAKYLVFAEGFRMLNNPLFNALPLQGTKGQLIKIKAPKLKLRHILKGSVFVIPLPMQEFLVGATYEWKDKTEKPTEDSKNWLLAKLQRILKCDFEITDHYAGIRPTVVDRKPLVGAHPDLPFTYTLNGFGSRGVLLAPYLAKMLYNFIELNEPIDLSVDVKRFY